MTRLQDQRIWLAGGAVAALLIIAVGWLGFTGPKLQSVRQIHNETAATQAQNDELMTATTVLRNKTKRLDRYTASLETALAELPYDSGLPAFTRQLNAQGKARHVLVSSVVVSGASPVVAAPAATAATAATAAPAATGAGSAGVFAIEVTVQSTGSLTHQLAFLRSLQRVGPRRALVTATQVSPGSGSSGGSVDRVATVSTQLTVFSTPRTPAQVRQLKKLLRGDLER